eukprot:scaffold4582_cov51-Phaeocystis_antarctica.AAC.1
MPIRYVRARVPPVRARVLPVRVEARVRVGVWFRARATARVRARVRVGHGSGLATPAWAKGGTHAAAPAAPAAFPSLSAATRRNPPLPRRSFWLGVALSARDELERSAPARRLGADNEPALSPEACLRQRRRSGACVTPPIAPPLACNPHPHPHPHLSPSPSP